MNTMAPDQKTIRLSNSTLDALPEGIERPTYDRAKLTPGIVHIGLGNFHRAHQAWYLHRLMQRGEALDWAIIGAGVRAPDRLMRDKLLAQDCLNTLIELDPSGMAAEVTGAMIGFLPVEDDNASLIAQMSDPAIRIVSLTVTESGYYQTTTGALDTDHPDIQHDAARPDTPKTAFGAMVAAYKNRRAAGVPAFTGQCCDNLRDNGAILAQTVIGLAELSDPDLAQWIKDNASFPNAMVDCIVPATGPNELALAQSLGIDDAAPVTHENFRQWVVEDNFALGRPAWDKVGATLTDDVHAFETMKIRILNAGHQVVANAGELLSCPTIAATMQDPDIKAFFRKVETDEITPYVDPVPGMTPAAYLDLIETRFANPKIHDTTRRVAFDGTARHPGFLHPILRDALAADGVIDGLALTQALWAHMCAGIRDDGSAIEPNDPNWDARVATAQAAKTDPQLWLAQDTIYGDLSTDDRFAQSFAKWLTMLNAEGTRATLKTYCG